MHIRQLVLSVTFALALILPCGFGFAAQGAGVDVRIWTVDSNGEPVYAVCYTLVEYSNPGCDENRDGNVLFQDVAPGRYYVEPQTVDGGFYYAETFTILIDELHTDHVVEAFPYRGSDSSGSSITTPESVDVHLIMRDPETGESLTDVCFELVGYSNVGCDENEDGHVTFADIPVGTYTVRQTKWPVGYEKMNDYDINVATPQVGTPLTILLAQSPDQANEGHTNYSVVFYDGVSNEVVAGPENCAQFRLNGIGTISNVGCDEDVIDGQADFMGVNVTPVGFSSHHRVDVFPQCGYEFSQFTGTTVTGNHTAILWAQLSYIGGNCG